MSTVCLKMVLPALFLSLLCIPPILGHEFKKLELACNWHEHAERCCDVGLEPAVVHLTRDKERLLQLLHASLENYFWVAGRYLNDGSIEMFHQPTKLQLVANVDKKQKLHHQLELVNILDQTNLYFGHPLCIGKAATLTKKEELNVTNENFRSRKIAAIGEAFSDNKTTSVNDETLVDETKSIDNTLVNVKSLLINRVQSFIDKKDNFSIQFKDCNDGIKVLIFDKENAPLGHGAIFKLVPQTTGSPFDSLQESRGTCCKICMDGEFEQSAYLKGYNIPKQMTFNLHVEASRNRGNVQYSLHPDPVVFEFVDKDGNNLGERKQ